MKLKKIIPFTLSLVILGSLFAGCSKEVTKLDEINLTYVKSPLNVPSIIQKEKGLFGEEFKKDKISVNFHEITSGPEQTQALAAGDLDFLHALGGTSALIAISQGVDMKILNVYSRGAKAFMLLTESEEIKSLEDLKGKKIGGPKGTVLHQLLVAALQSVGLTEDDVEFVSMGIPEASAALSNGSIDVAMLAGPAALKAKEAGATVVTTGEGLVDGTIVTAVSTKFYEAHKDVVERFLKVQDETLEMMKNNEEEILKIVSEEVGLSVEQTKQMYSWYGFDRTISEGDIEELERTQEFLLNNELQQNEINIEDIIIR